MTTDSPTLAAPPSVTRTSRADKNYYSISAGTYQLYAGTPEAQPAAAPDEYGFTLMPENPFAWDAIFKTCDGSSGYNLVDLCIAQGRENAQDCNNFLHHSSFAGTFGAGGGTGQQVITVKGGCFNITFSGWVASDGEHATVTVGAWSDQCHDRSHNLDFSGLIRADGRPLTFILARCDRSTIKLPPGAKVLFWKSVGYEVYWHLKRAAVALGFFGKR